MMRDQLDRGEASVAGKPITRGRIIAAVLDRVAEGVPIADAMAAAKVSRERWDAWGRAEPDLFERLAHARLAAAEHLMRESQEVADRAAVDHSAASPSWEISDRRLRSDVRQSRANHLTLIAQRALEQHQSLAQSQVSVDARQVHLSAALSLSDAQLTALLGRLRPDLVAQPTLHVEQAQVAEDAPTDRPGLSPDAER